ncbi:uncharacterized protein LOC117330339 [Pecten maximus]|uniref:uncharacterized protein LOC117330339 n=1 Tax=Pecten maximus TaxID=6579 RepID=UPI0014587E80|nr:uncharacterized protein LOC117330339 [Pecten maximus]
MLRLLAIIVCVALAQGAPNRHCPDVLAKAGLTTKYNETIAHAVHSMTVEALKLFNPRATSNNKVPTVNQDLNQSQKVLPYAPEAHTGNGFSTMTMNIIDGILSTIGHSNDGLGPNWSPIERVAHVFHMWDLWHKIYSTAWQDIQADTPSQATCDCVLDVDNNGVKAAVQWVADHYESGTPITLLNRPIPKLTDAQTWGVWKDRLLHYYTPAALKDAAIYLYCETQHM